jgi:hypothetical protein
MQVVRWQPRVLSMSEATLQDKVRWQAAWSSMSRIKWRCLYVLHVVQSPGACRISAQYASSYASWDSPLSATVNERQIIAISTPRLVWLSVA